MKQLILLLFLTTGFITWSQVPNYVPSDGLVGWWPFNGNADDESGNGNNGTNNGATLTSDRFGNVDAAYDFDGDDWISIANSASLNWGLSDYTVSVWVNKNNAAPWLQNIIAKQETTAGDYYGWNLGLVYNDVRFTAGSGYDGSWMNNGNIESDYSISDNQWYLISGVFDLTNSLTSLYINGALHTSTTASGTVNPNNSQDLKFGAYMPSGAPSGPEFFYGKIDDIGIWNRALTECEIQDLYNAELNTPMVDLGNDQTICSGDDLELDAGTGYNYYNWSTGETTQTITVSDAGTYTATVGDSTPVMNNHSMSFDGQDDYIESLSNTGTNYTNGGAIYCKIKADAVLNPGSEHYVVSQYGHQNFGTNNAAFSLSVGGQNGIYAMIRDDAGNSSEWSTTNFNVLDNQWHEIGMSYDAINHIVSITVDGVTEQSGTLTTLGNIQSPNPIYLGKHWNPNWPHFYNGLVDEVRVWNTTVDFSTYDVCSDDYSGNCILHYDFEEGSGTTALDITANGNNGSINGAIYDTDSPEQICSSCSATDSVVVSILDATITASAESVCFGDSAELSVSNTSGYSLDFDGDDDYVALNDIQIDNTFSFNTWVYVDENANLNWPDAGAHIFSIGANNNGIDWASFAFGISNNSVGVNEPTLICEFGNPPLNQFAADIPFPIDEWVNIGVTFDNGTLSMYQNSVNVFNNNIGITPSANENNVFIGSRGPSWGSDTYYFEGLMNNIAYWNQALTESEIQQYMTCPPNGTEAGLIGYWNFDEGSGTTANDLTSNGNNGTINGASYNTDVPSTCSTEGLITWSTGDTTSSVWVTPGATSTYSVTLDDGNASCTNDIEITVSDPQIDFGGDQTICSGDDLELDAGAGYNYFNWSTGETTQTITVSAAGTYTATVGDSTPVVNNHSMSFDGSSNNVEFIGTSSIANFGTNDFTISQWFKSDSNLSGHFCNSLLKIGGSTNNYYDLTPRGDYAGIAHFHFANGNGQDYYAVSNTAIDDGNWHYITGVREGDLIKIFIDGIFQNQTLLPANANADNSANVKLFPNACSASTPVITYIDEVSIWNTALSQQEVQQYMNCPPTGNEAGLVGYWNFEEGSGTSALDLTANGNNGTINGATYDTETPEQVCIGCTASADAVVIEAVPTSSTDTQEACESFTWIDGNTYTDDNTTATFVTTNAAGCDSTITLNLTILESSSITDIHEVCEEFTWIDGNTYTEDNSTATFVTANAAGCDSTITLNLTILESSSSTDAHEECPSFTWIDGNTYTESNNTATFITTNTAGCDSVITLNLTINNLTTLDAGANQTVCEDTDVTLTATGAAVYAWDNGIQNGVPFPALLGSNTYNVEGTDANGCEDEQSVTITGTAYPELSFEVADPACQGEASGNAVVVASNGTSPYTFVWNNGALQAENNSIPAGTYEVTVTDNIGCEAQGVVVVIDPSEPCFNIPGGISPNGDGINDTWTIGGLSQYPDANVNVFDRWGQAVYSGNATSDAWDGTINGNECPTADYYYILELGDGQKFNGVVTLKR